MLIYCTDITPRIRYIFQTLLQAEGLSEIAFTNNIGEYRNSTLPCINYSTSKIKDKELWVSPVSLLFQTGFHPVEIELFEYRGSNAFFKTAGDIGFDVFAASFYLLTRYEEYLPHQHDIYGRYAYANSLAWKGGFLKVPVINIWMKQVIELLKQRFPAMQLNTRCFKFTPSYDVDIAYNYKGKGWLRNFKGLVADVLRLRWNEAANRLAVFTAGRKDPADVYDWLIQLHQHSGTQPTFFFLVAARASGYDKNINPQSAAFRSLVQKLSVKADIGWHPSWQSYNKPGVMREEKQRLEAVAGKPVIESRQHYIKMSLPETYRQLMAIGITNDYSMGYGSINGFRASYCLPYRWFDLELNETTTLTIHPFCFMDANSNFEQGLTAEQAGEELEQFYNIVKAVDGELITIFHNHFLAETKEWDGWRKMWEDRLALIR